MVNRASDSPPALARLLLNVSLAKDAFYTIWDMVKFGVHFRLLLSPGLGRHLSQPTGIASMNPKYFGPVLVTALMVALAGCNSDSPDNGTADPSVSPTASPAVTTTTTTSMSPSPSPGPSGSLTPSPTASATTSPSVSPSVSPSTGPSGSPTAAPSVSTVPSVSSSMSPPVSPSASVSPTAVIGAPDLWFRLDSSQLQDLGMSPETHSLSYRLQNADDLSSQVNGSLSYAAGSSQLFHVNNPEGWPVGTSVRLSLTSQESQDSRAEGELYCYPQDLFFDRQLVAGENHFELECQRLLSFPVLITGLQPNSLVELNLTYVERVAVYGFGSTVRLSSTLVNLGNPYTANYTNDGVGSLAFGGIGFLPGSYSLEVLLPEDSSQVCTAASPSYELSANGAALEVVCSQASPIAVGAPGINWADNAQSLNFARTNTAFYAVDEWDGQQFRWVERQRFQLGLDDRDFTFYPPIAVHLAAGQLNYVGLSSGQYQVRACHDAALTHCASSATIDVTASLSSLVLLNTYADTSVRALRHFAPGVNNATRQLTAQALDVPYAELGSALAISQDKQFMVAGAPQDNSALVYQYQQGFWLPFAKLVPPSSANSGSEFGTSVAVVQVGSDLIIAVGMPGDNWGCFGVHKNDFAVNQPTASTCRNADNGNNEENSGSVWVFQLPMAISPSAPVNTFRVKAPNTHAGARFGQAVALANLNGANNMSGYRLLVGAPGDRGNWAGSATHVFAHDSGLQTAFRDQGAVFSFDAPMANNLNPAFAFKSRGAALADYQDNDIQYLAPGNSGFGYSLAISANGRFWLTGAPLERAVAEGSIDQKGIRSAYSSHINTNSSPDDWALAVGDETRGAAYLFDDTLEIAHLVRPMSGVMASSRRFGSTLALGCAGDCQSPGDLRLAIGAPVSGDMVVYKIANNGVTQSSFSAVWDNRDFARALTMSADGSFLAVSDHFQVLTYLVNYSGAQPMLQMLFYPDGFGSTTSGLTSPEAHAGEFGAALAVSADGLRLMVGAPGSACPGAIVSQPRGCVIGSQSMPAGAIFSY